MLAYKYIIYYTLVYLKNILLLCASLQCNVSFVRHCKVKPFLTMKNDAQFVEVFACLGKSTVLEPSVMAAVKQYVCAMYCKANYTNVNELRYDIFKTRYQPNTSSKHLAVGDRIDLSLLPPCRSSLEMHTLRANYVAYTWKQANVTHPDIPSPLGLGWTSDNE